MTPKEKAKELFNKFSNTARSYIEGKQCALIAVDEIISALDKSLINADIEWFKQVKKEIEKL